MGVRRTPFTVSATELDLPAQSLTFSASGLPADAIFSVTDGIATVSQAVTITVADVNGCQSWLWSKNGSTALSACIYFVSRL